MAINLFTGGSSRAEFRLPDVTFSGPAPVGSTISATLSFDLAGTLATNALHAFTSDARLTSEASAVINGHLMEPTSFIGSADLRERRIRPADYSPRIRTTDLDPQALRARIAAREPGALVVEPVL